MAMFEVLIDGHEPVYQGESHDVALTYFKLYSEYSKERIGIAAGRTIDLLRDDDLLRTTARTHDTFTPTLKDRLEYFWFNWGNDICKVAFVAIAVAWALFTLYYWGPMIRAGLGSYLNG